MRKEWNAVEILRHSRHDWLNKLQLIKGNLALNHINRVHEIIEEILIETRNESKLTNLKAKELAALLMLFNWEGHYFVLEVEVLGTERDLSKYDDKLTSWCAEFLNMLNGAIQPFAENTLILTIQIADEDVCFIFDFRGIIDDKSKISTYIEAHENDGLLKIVDFDIHNDEMFIATKFRYSC